MTREKTNPRGRILVRLLVMAALALAVLVRRVYVNPELDQPLRRADAVVVLGGTPYERFHHGIQLAEGGLAPEVAISNSVGPDDPDMRKICAEPTRVRLSCFLPVPWTTRGEAQEIRELAAARGWHSIILVTTTAHIERARYIVRRCFAGDIQVTNYPEGLTVGQSVQGWLYQSGGWLKALAESGC